MKKQAKMLEKQFAESQEKLKNTEVHGEAGGGLVKITLTGEKKMKDVVINPECVDKDDIEGLQDLIIAAYDDADSKLKDVDTGMPAGLPFSL